MSYVSQGASLAISSAVQARSISRSPSASRASGWTSA